MTVAKTEEVYADVKKYYGYRAENEVNLALRARIAAALGYDPISAALVPEAANIGEGCGNPLLIANLTEVNSESFSLNLSLLPFAYHSTMGAGRNRSRSRQWGRIRLLPRSSKSRVKG